MAPNQLLRDTKILIVDDDDLLAWTIENELKNQGAEVLRANCIRDALEKFPQLLPDLVLSDIRLPDGNGLELLKKWHFERPDLPIIMMTGHSDVDSAITALRFGAFDYLEKPFQPKTLLSATKKASEIALLRTKLHRMAGPEVATDKVDIIGSSPATKRMKDQLRKFANSKASTFLVVGDTGTGKELAARSLHFWNEERAAHPFIEINCASIPENLLESELFGYEKGAFTDAKDKKLGLFEIAKAGTIFLDEIGELPLKLQSKLLRAIECRRFKRLGGSKDIAFQARIVAATNRDLPTEVAKGEFREDLFYRLNALVVTLPSLHERAEDIPELVDFFMAQLNADLGLRVDKIDLTALTTLTHHRWPGNIRELRNVLQRAMILTEDNIIKLEDLSGLSDALRPNDSTHGNRHEEGGRLPSKHELPGYSTTTFSIAAPKPTATIQLPDRGLHLDDVEKDLIIQALDRTHQNQTKAAKLLGISRHTLRYRLEKHGLAFQDGPENKSETLNS